jgi:phytoene dehydrogenase-like protein
MADSTPESVDAVVIGAGIGGLLAATLLGQAGKRVLLLENLSFIGGRFSAFQVNGAEVPSGAFHTFPHGGRGPFSRLLKRIGADVKIESSQAFAAFHVGGKAFVAQNPFHVRWAVPRLRDKLFLPRALFQCWIQRHYDGSFGDWLRSIGASAEVIQLYDRFAQFALSAYVDDLPYEEGRAIIRMIIYNGLPGVPQGGARAVARGLGQAAERAGVTIRKNSRVEALLSEDGHICGATVYDRRKDSTYGVRASLVVSNTGPLHTRQLAQSANLNNIPTDDVPQPAIGLKIQVISPRSLLDHDTIMFCLDTQRIAGIVQASNVDPKLAPEGHHLLVSHQTLPPGADWQSERDIALQDWRYLFGDAFDDCDVIGASQFPARFPVNWATQGHDLRAQPYADFGLWMVGDAIKPPGHMMVEGVAAGTEQVIKQILQRGTA